MSQRGVFEREPGSGVWWICYFDRFGKKHREKAGTKSVEPVNRPNAHTEHSSCFGLTQSQRFRYAFQDRRFSSHCSSPWFGGLVPVIRLSATGGSRSLMWAE
jgi:hypothetical protein